MASSARPICPCSSASEPSISSWPKSPSPPGCPRRPIRFISSRSWRIRSLERRFGSIPDISSRDFRNMTL